MRTFGVVTVATTALSVLAVVPTSQAASVKLSGSLSGARLPRPTAGVSLVQAMSLRNGALGAAGYVSGQGRFSLKVPPGPYALLASSVLFKRGKPTVRLVGALWARAGKPRRVSVSLRPRRVHKRTHGARAGAAARPSARAAVGGSAESRRVGVMDFTGGAPYQNRGLASMVVTDLVQLDAGPPCAFTVLELQRREEILREIRLQQTEFFDPASRVQPGHLLQPNLVVNGSLVSHGGDDVSYALTVVKNGKVKGTVSGRTGADGWLTASGAIARQLAKIICEPDDMYFRIVGYTRTETSSTAHGQRNVTDALSGGPGPVTELPECPNPFGCSNMFLLEAKVTTTANGRVTGAPEPGCPGGSFTYPTSVLQNPVRQAVTFDPDWVAPATASDAMIPSVGDVIVDECDAMESAVPQEVSAGVPADDLLSGRPVTFRLSGSGTAPSSGDHPGIAISWTLSESITVQRVKADGSQL